MKIGIDVDGVLINFENALLAKAEIFDIENCRGNGVIYKDKFHSQERYDWTEDEKEKFLVENLAITTEETELMPSMKYVINKLKQMGHELIVISARGIEDDKLIDVVLNKLKKENITFNKYYWKERNKPEICKKENIDIMIDDNPFICQKMIDNCIKTLYFRGSIGWNLESKYIKEVKNWGEIYRFIKDMDSKIE